MLGDDPRTGRSDAGGNYGADQQRHPEARQTCLHAREVYRGGLPTSEPPEVEGIDHHDH